MPIGDRHRRRRGRNVALAGALALVVVAFFVITLVGMDGLPRGQW